MGHPSKALAALGRGSPKLCLMGGGGPGRPPKSLSWAQPHFFAQFALLWDDLRCRLWFRGFPPCAGGWTQPRWDWGPVFLFPRAPLPLEGLAILLGGGTSRHWALRLVPAWPGRRQREGCTEPPACLLRCSHWAQGQAWGGPRPCFPCPGELAGRSQAGDARGRAGFRGASQKGCSMGPSWAEEGPERACGCSGGVLSASEAEAERAAELERGAPRLPCPQPRLAPPHRPGSPSAPVPSGPPCMLCAGEAA